jgi:hypothetical protein
MDSKLKSSYKKKQKGIFYQKTRRNIFDIHKSQELKQEFVDIFQKEQTSKSKDRCKYIGELSKIIFQIKQIYNILESKSFDGIKQVFEHSKDLIDNLIKEINSMKTDNLYKNEKCDGNFESVLEANKMNDFRPICVDPDGNCFYRAISKLTFNDQKYFFIIKIISHYKMFQNHDLFTKLLKEKHYGISFETFLEESMRKNEWSNEIVLLGTSLALKRPIYSYSNERYIDTSMIISHPDDLDKKALLVGFEPTTFGL